MVCIFGGDTVVFGNDKEIFFIVVYIVFFGRVLCSSYGFYRIVDLFLFYIRGIVEFLVVKLWLRVLGYEILELRFRFSFSCSGSVFGFYGFLGFGGAFL